MTEFLGFLFLLVFLVVCGAAMVWQARFDTGYKIGINAGYRQRQIEEITEREKAEQRGKDFSERQKYGVLCAAEFEEEENA